MDSILIDDGSFLNLFVSLCLIIQVLLRISCSLFFDVNLFLNSVDLVGNALPVAISIHSLLYLVLKQSVYYEQQRVDPLYALTSHYYALVYKA